MLRFAGTVPIKRLLYLIRPICIAFGLLLCGWLLIELTTTVAAQQLAREWPDLQTGHHQTGWGESSVDILQFPEITVHFVCASIAGEKPTLSDFTYAEDGIRLKPTSFITQQIPTHVAILLDLYKRSSSSETLPPESNDILIQARSNITGLVKSGVFDTDSDRISYFVPSTETVPLASILDVEATTYDLNKVGNRLTELIESDKKSLEKFTPITETTTLLDSIFAIVTNSTLLTRTSVVVYSDGVDRLSEIAVQELITEANSKNIAIHTVLIPTDEQEQNPSILEEIALETGGIYYEDYKNTAIVTETLIALYDSTDRCGFTYRTAEVEPRLLEITSVDGRLIERVALPSVDLPSPNVTVTLPVTAGHIFTYAKPSIVTISSTWNLGGNHTIQALTLTYEVEGQSIATSNLTDVVTLTNITEQNGRGEHVYSILMTEHLTIGSYLVRATIVDELGRSAQDEIPFGISPQPPAPSIFAVWQQRLEQVLRTIGGLFATIASYLRKWLLVLLLALALLLTTWLLWWTNRDRKAPWRPISQEQTVSVYDLALVRVRTDPDAPAMLHIVPLTVPKKMPRERHADHSHEKVRIPDSFYHPSTVSTNGSTPNGRSHEAFTTLYGAILKIESRAENQKPALSIIREASSDSFEDEMSIAQRKPIIVRKAGTRYDIPIIGGSQAREFGPLEDGDILQLGKTHYKFVDTPSLADSGQDNDD